MAKKIINIGQTANDKSGDPLRTAFSKINENFDELYANTDVTDIDGGNAGAVFSPSQIIDGGGA